MRLIIKMDNINHYQARIQNKYSKNFRLNKLQTGSIQYFANNTTLTKKITNKTFQEIYGDATQEIAMLEVILGNS